MQKYLVRHIFCGGAYSIRNFFWAQLHYYYETRLRRTLQGFVRSSA